MRERKHLKGGITSVTRAALGGLLVLCFCAESLQGQVGEVGELSGSIGVTIPAGTPASPSYKVVSAGLKSEAAFRGQIASIVDNNVTFDRLPDLLDPTKLAWPFKTGMFATTRARAAAMVNPADGNLTSIYVEHPGFGYQRVPEVRIHPPDTGNDVATTAIDAFALAELNGTRINRIVLTSSGKGYQSAPHVEIEGGPHFLRVVEEDDLAQGRFFLITANSGDRLTLANPLNENLAQILKPDALVEITPAWTLGSLFGYEKANLLLADGNETAADRVHLRDGNATGYRAYYHDGTTWRKVGDPNTDVAETILYPDEAFILARRSPTPLNLAFAGAILTVNSFAHLPAKDKSFLMNNPFGADMMLSDLIAAENLTTDSNVTGKWFAHPSDEHADAVEVLHAGVWTTYWHDGTNKDVSLPARATARAGSGIAGALTPADLSFGSGSITNVSNPPLGQNVTVTTDAPHGLGNGFVVRIRGVLGYKTDSNATAKRQVDENGTVVPAGSGLVIEASANGFYEITNVTANTFQLKGKSGNADYKEGGTWTTGNAGSGYDTDAHLLFVGGGGRGAKGVARVSGGKVVSITLTDGGAGYLTAPKVVVNSGGWRRVGSGNSPVNDALVPAGAGILLVRRHPNGVPSRLRITNPVD